MLKVFVYGTLKPGQRNYPIYCEGKVIKAEKCWTKGQLFALPAGYPALIKGNDKVEGFLLTFADELVLRNLDKLEGYDARKIADMNYYQRQKIIVYDASNNSLGEVWAYLMTLAKVKSLNGVLIPSGCWE